jgi:fatty acid desaturase
VPKPPPSTEFDPAAFERDLLALRAEIDAKVGSDDLRHLKKMERWARTCTLLGYATAWIAPNPVSAFLISQGNTARWTIVMHHVSHRALDRVPGVPERLTSKRFARGARRLLDWLDWILPEAWHHEHDVLHHYHTGDEGDPDLVEDHASVVRDAEVPLPLKYAAVAFYACTWKWSYYAPNTLAVLHRARRRRSTMGAPQTPPAPPPSQHASAERYSFLFSPLTPEGRELWSRCLLPYATVRFALIPALFLPLGPFFAANVLLNSAAAEVMANVHSFLIIAPSHAGADLYRFEGKADSRAELWSRQVLGSANYRTGSDLCDFLHGFLNYQIEHHLFPDLSPLRYREIQPRVKAICEKHGLPYVQEGLLRRARKLVDIMVGRASMQRLPRRAPADA